MTCQTYSLWPDCRPNHNQARCPQRFPYSLCSVFPPSLYKENLRQHIEVEKIVRLELSTLVSVSYPEYEYVEIHLQSALTQFLQNTVLRNIRTVHMERRSQLKSYYHVCKHIVLLHP